MTAFDYQAFDAAGRRRTGRVQASSEETARRALTRRRLLPVRVEAAAPRAAQLGVGRLGHRDLALATRQLATLISVAPMEEALRTLVAQAEKERVKVRLTAVHADVVEGYRLSDALRRSRGFPDAYCAMVAAGETSGALPAILERMADLLEQEQQVRAKIAAALVYPMVLAATAVAVVAALVAFVVPKVVDQFDSMGQTLPLLTRIVIALSDAVRGYGLLALAAGAVFAAAGAFALRRPAVRLAFDRMLLALPVIGRLIRQVEAARLARALSTMMASGLPMLEGLELAARTQSNRVLRSTLEDMALSIREGGSLSSALRRAAVFPPILVHMAASGEASGRLEPMLSKAADYLDREFSTFTTAALSLLEPAIIILMGGVVTLIVLSILLPILQINALALG